MVTTTTQAQVMANVNGGVSKSQLFSAMAYGRPVMVDGWLAYVMSVSREEGVFAPTSNFNVRFQSGSIHFTRFVKTTD